MAIKRNFVLLFCLAVLPGLSGCMTTGYSTAKDPNLVKKWNVTIIEIEPQNIYNSLGVSLLGPFAAVEHVGEKITFLDPTGAQVTVVQPKSNHYQLHPGDEAVYIMDRGQVWVQPTNYPLPPEFIPASTQKLQELNALYKAGLIEKSEYETKKQEILEGM